MCEADKTGNNQGVPLHGADKYILAQPRPKKYRPLSSVAIYWWHAETSRRAPTCSPCQRDGVNTSVDSVKQDEVSIGLLPQGIDHNTFVSPSLEGAFSQLLIAEGEDIVSRSVLELFFFVVSRFDFFDSYEKRSGALRTHAAVPATDDNPP